MFCGNCGREILTGNKFCIYCGAKLNVVGASSPSTTQQPQTQYAPQRVENSPVNPSFPKSAKESTFDKISRFFGLTLLSVCILVNLFAPNDVVLISVNIAIVVLSVVCLVKKFRLKGFTIIALTISAIIFLAAFIVDVSDYFSKDIQTLSKTTEESKSPSDNYKTVTLGEIDFEMSESYVFDGSSSDILFSTSSNNNVIAYYTNIEQANLNVYFTNNIDEMFDSFLKESFPNCSYSEGPSNIQIDGMDAYKASFEGKDSGKKIKGILLFFYNVYTVNNEEYQQPAFLLHISSGLGSDEYISDFERMINSATVHGDKILLKESNSSSADGVSPELKEFLDSYESFMDEYVDFMKKYSSGDGNTLSLLNDYTKFMSEYLEFVEKASQYDPNNMNAADSAYYIDTIARIEKKLLMVADN